MKEKVFVTGVEGFVGAHLVKNLLEKDYEVVGLCHHHKPVTTLTMLNLDNKITKVYGDVCDRSLIKKILTSYYIKQIYHLAAQAIVGVALRDPLNTYKTNAIGTATILDVCRDLKTVRSILVSSTDKVYGEGLNKKEGDTLNAQGIYENSKIVMDYIARSFYYVYKLPIVVIRACNIYGEYDFNKRIIPNTIRTLKNNQQPIIFEGEKSLREYIYVDDVCNSYVMLSQNIEKSMGAVFNIGSGQVKNQAEIVKMLIKISGKNITPKFIEKPKSMFEIYQQTIDSDLIKKLFNWKAKYVLEEGLKRTWERWKKNRNCYENA